MSLTKKIYGTLGLAAVLASGFSLLTIPASADTANVTANLTVTAGALTITADSSAPLNCSGGCSVSASSQNATGNITNVEVTDTRGSDLSWSVVMTATNFANTPTNDRFINLCETTANCATTSNLAITPGSFSTTVGQTFTGSDNTSLQNVTTLSAIDNAAGISNNLNIGSATPGGNQGVYNKDIGLSLTLPPFTQDANYNSTMVLTVS